MHGQEKSLQAAKVYNEKQEGRVSCGLTVEHRIAIVEPVTLDIHYTLLTVGRYNIDILPVQRVSIFTGFGEGAKSGKLRYPVLLLIIGPLCRGPESQWMIKKWTCL